MNEREVLTQARNRPVAYGIRTPEQASSFLFGFDVALEFRVLDGFGAWLTLSKNLRTSEFTSAISANRSYRRNGRRNQSLALPHRTYWTKQPKSDIFIFMIEMLVEFAQSGHIGRIRTGMSVQEAEKVLGPGSPHPAIRMLGSNADGFPYNWGNLNLEITGGLVSAL